MKTYKVTIVPPKGAQQQTVIQAKDYTEAKKLAELQFSGCRAENITEVR